MSRVGRTEGGPAATQKAGPGRAQSSKQTGGKGRPAGAQKGAEFGTVLQQAGQRRAAVEAVPQFRRDPHLDSRESGREEISWASAEGAVSRPQVRTAALPESAPAGPMPARLDELAGELVRRLELSRLADRAQVQLQLDAPDLGIEAVRVALGDKGLEIAFRADAAGGRLLEENLGTLRAALERRGLEAKAIVVEPSGAVQVGDRAERRAAAPAVAAPVAGESAEAGGRDQAGSGQSGRDESRGRFLYEQRPEPRRRVASPGPERVGED